MKTSYFLAMAAVMAMAGFGASAAFAFTGDQGNGPVLSFGTPHLADPDEQAGVFFGGGNSEPSGYFTPGGGSSAGSAGNNVMYRSGYSIEPDKSAGDRVKRMPQQ